MADRAARDAEIRRLYVECDLPIMVVAGRVDLSYARVRQILHDLNAPMKPAGPNYHSPHTWQGKKASAQRPCPPALASAAGAEPSAPMKTHAH